MMRHRSLALGGRHPRRFGAWLSGTRHLIVLLVASLTLLFACRAEKAGPSLLAKQKPSRVQQVTNPQRITDGTRARNGDNWNTQLTSIIGGPQAFIEWDLGATKELRAAYVQGDNNDEYVLSASEDGTNFSEIWVAPPNRASSGMQTRVTRSLQTSARHLRLSARGGDGSFSVAELQVFSDAAGVSETALSEGHGLPTPEALRGKLMLLVLAFGVFLFATWRYSSRLWSWLPALFPVAVGYLIYDQMLDSWPLAMREVAFMRGVAGALAALALLREFVFRRSYPARTASVLSTLGVAALLAFASFFNMGHPQFTDHKVNQPSFVHNFDMRVYYPVAKYFKELRYDGLYQASVAAYVDDAGVSIDSLNRVELRDLRTHKMTRVAQVKQQILDISKRFSPARWATFKEDMRYFRQNMGVGDYLGSMRDHGGNATPVWMALGHLIFAGTTANNATLTLGGLLDPLLLLAAFAVIWRTFGVRAGLLSMVVFGANDFYMFGSNWAGATLRHDWMAYLAFGLCALRAHRFALGGAFLAMSAAIRAFPAFALLGVLIPFAWWAWEHRQATGKWPKIPDLVEKQKPVLLTVAGAAACALVMFIASSLILDFGAWTEWLAKVRMLDRDPHVNEVSLRALIAGANDLQGVAIGHRAPVYWAVAALFVGGVILAGRNKPLDQAAAIATVLIPIVFNPANYYAHFIYVLPILALERTRSESASGHPPMSGYDGWIWAIMPLVCVAGYWTTLTNDVELHFQLGSALAIIGLGVLLVLILYRDRTLWLPPTTTTRLCSLLRRHPRRD